MGERTYESEGEKNTERGNYSPLVLRGGWRSSGCSVEVTRMPWAHVNVSSILTIPTVAVVYWLHNRLWPCWCGFNSRRSPGAALEGSVGEALQGGNIPQGRSLHLFACVIVPPVSHPSPRLGGPELVFPKHFDQVRFLARRLLQLSFSPDWDFVSRLQEHLTVSQYRQVLPHDATGSRSGCPPDETGSSPV